MKIHWLDDVEDHDYPAAESYLSLVLHPDDVDTVMSQFPYEVAKTFKAKDLLRASGLPLLVDDVHVERDLHKISHGVSLSPILVVNSCETLYVADGYHRLCAAYQTSSDAEVPCKIVYL